jgi:hypothetical protein
MTRDRGQAHRERLGQLAHCRLALGKAGEDGAARRIGERGERQGEVVGGHLTDHLSN